MRNDLNTASHGDPVLFPFPEGWYFVASRDSILKKGLIQRTWLGETVIAWRDGQSRICVAEAACPHLGANLGPGAGGRIRNGRLVCPFHGFEYDAGGRCVATPFARPPKTARLKTFETQEVLGMVFAWWGQGGRAPQWRLPQGLSDGAEWSRLGYRRIRFPGHPQETTENSVDLAHLRYVHGYANVRQVEPVSVNGAYLRSCFDFSSSRTIAGLTLSYEVSAVTHVHGLGCSQVDVREHTVGMDARMWVLSTPLDGVHIELVIANQVRQIHHPRRFISGLGFVPERWRAETMNSIFLWMQKYFVMQDVAIWGRKRYRERPRLARSDGEFAMYRRYCRQFYPDDLQDSSSAAQPASGLGTARTSPVKLPGHASHGLGQ